MKASRKIPVSLDELNPFELEGTPEDIALVEEGLAILADLEDSYATTKVIA